MDWLGCWSWLCKCTGWGAGAGGVSVMARVLELVV